VTFLDRDADALAFAAASVERNGCRPAALCQVDFTRENLGRRFDLILAAEVLYDAAAFTPLVRFFTRHLWFGGAVMLADAHRTDTRAFYHALTASGYCFTVRRTTVREERLPLAVDIVTARRSRDSDLARRQIT
jgi:2-polyprenyl-3-methyl-5-hydroxy-6-metoxy-1,4-benzoquinol methylase